MKNKNIGKTTGSYFFDSQDVRLAEGKLERNKRIKTYFQKDDKIPNIDGYFETLAPDGTPQKRFVVQIKGEEKLEDRKKLKKFSYSADTGFFQYMFKEIESNPGMFFVAERTTGRVFFKYVSRDFLEDLDKRNLLSQGSFTIHFDEEDLLDEERFYRLCEEIQSGGGLGMTRIQSSRPPLFLHTSASLRTASGSTGKRVLWIAT